MPALCVLMQAWLFPPRIRDFPGKRWVRILLRTLHLVGVAGLGGAYFYEAAPADWLPYLWLTVASGVLMMALEVWSHGIWLLQLSGLLIQLKCLLLVLNICLGGAWQLPLILAVLGISGVIAHSPARIRHYGPWHRRVLTVDNWLGAPKGADALGERTDR